MRKFMNPKPTLEIEDTAKHYLLGFTFEEEITRQEAANSITEFLANHDGKVQPDWLKIGEGKKLHVPTFCTDDDQFIVTLDQMIDLYKKQNAANSRPITIKLDQGHALLTFISELSGFSIDEIKERITSD